MWLRTRKLNALLAPLAPVLDGRASDGRVAGTYRGYAVSAWPHSGYPIETLSSPTEGAVGPAPVNMLRVELAGVGGSQPWHCQSAASSYLQDLTSRFTSGRALERFASGEFKFAGVDTLKDSVERMGERLVKRLGVPLRATADPALQKRLVAAGLFGELDALRLGGHPYLPRVEFMPSGRELAALYFQSPAFERGRPALEQRLRAAGAGDYRSLIEARIAEAEAENPGRLEFDIEAGQAQVPGHDQFRAVLEHAVRIAEINAEVNDDRPTPP